AQLFVATPYGLVQSHRDEITRPNGYSRQTLRYDQEFGPTCGSHRQSDALSSNPTLLNFLQLTRAQNFDWHAEDLIRVPCASFCHEDNLAHALQTLNYHTQSAHTDVPSESIYRG